MTEPDQSPADEITDAFAIDFEAGRRAFMKAAGLGGAAPFITDKTYLSAASSILGAESYHIGAIRTLLFAQQDAFHNSATALISAARRNLSGANDDQGIGGDQSTLGGNFPTPSNIVPTDAHSLAYPRTPRQVLNIVYGKRGAANGGFFPNGANGGPEFRQLLSVTAG